MSRASLAPLNPKQTRFVEEYVIDLNATQAATRAGYSARTANEQGARLLAHASVREAIAERQAARAARTGITADAVLTRLWTIATADPRDLIEYRRTCCRHCHGADFLYQRTRNEIATARSAWESAQKKNSTDVFAEMGGDGYNATKPPHPDCPECFGEGLSREFVHDTRHLSAGAVMLYAGIKITKDGLDVKMHDQQTALLTVGKHLGMFKEKEEAPDEQDIAQKVRAALRAMADADGVAA